MIALAQVLVATDFSEPSDSALGYGRELARNFGASLILVHVVEDLVTRAYGLDGGVFTDAEMQRAVEAACQTRLEKLIGDEDREALHAEAVVVRSNTPAAAIVDYARQRKADIIVMGTHGRGGMAHLLMGSVAERVVRTAPCPVLTVRCPEREFVRPDALVAAGKA